MLLCGLCTKPQSIHGDNAAMGKCRCGKDRFVGDGNKAQVCVQFFFFFKKHPLRFKDQKKKKNGRKQTEFL